MPPMPPPSRDTLMGISESNLGPTSKMIEELDDVLYEAAAPIQRKNGGGGGGATSLKKNSVSSIPEEEEDGMMESSEGRHSLAELKTLRENAAMHGRVIRKAKRPSRATSICEEGKFGSSNNSSAAPTVAVNRCNKNLRKSRSGMGRGLPKKGNFIIISFFAEFSPGKMSKVMDIKKISLLRRRDAFLDIA